LGQARNNLYLAVKTWAAYIGLYLVFSSQEQSSPATKAWNQAVRCAKTLCAHQTSEGFIPAILGEGSMAKIIPAIEGLVFLLHWKQTRLVTETGPFAHLGDALRRHLNAILHTGICRFPDGGWKLSSTNNNSWLSKIYLCQHVARQIFGFPADAKADEAHAAWLLDTDNAFYAWSDQMVCGKAQGSKYYPRGVTSWLWLKETRT
ncbi:MAG: beta-xylosidase, partial [Verrucomicrobiia bacterium]